MKRTETGFTILELMIATAVFSIILIIVTTTIIGISDTYVKGSVQDQTQQSARSILSDISQDIQFNISNTIIPGGTESGVSYFCIGNDVYVYTLNQELTSSNNIIGLVRYYSTTCPDPPSVDVPTTLSAIAAIDPKYAELLSDNELLGALSIAAVNVNGSEAWTTNLEVAYGSSPVLYLSPTTGHYQCQSGSDSSFCAVSILTTTVTPRINNT